MKGNGGGEYPDEQWVKDVCKIGQGHDCCRYLTMHPTGWSCEKKTLHKNYFDDRVAREDMMARGDNCEGKDSRP